MEAKKTALYHIHKELGAKIIPFAGYDMPVRYNSQIEEHHTVRKSVGVFDVSHMGEFFVRGEGAFDLVQRITSNDVSKLSHGKIQYSCFPNQTGGIVDDLLVYCLSETEYMLVVNASNMAKDWDWIQKFNTQNVTIENRSDQMSLLAVQGPKAAQALQSLTNINLDQMVYYTFDKGVFAGVDNVIVSATGYTGSGGFEIYIPNQDAEEVWNKIFEAGKDFGIAPIGLAARDTLRLEMGFCLYGNDIDDHTSPLEAGLGWITKFTNDFTNSEFLKKQKEEGTTRRLAAFELLEKGIPRQGYEVLNSEGEVVGKVTSGTHSPSLDKGIGMAYINKPFNKRDTDIFIQIRKKQVKAKTVRLPFFKA